jgi:hypothetical protein
MDYVFEYVGVEDPRNNSLPSTSPNRPTSRSPTPRTCADRFNTISRHLLRFLRSLEREYVQHFTLAGVPQTTTNTDLFVQDLPRSEDLTIRYYAISLILCKLVKCMNERSTPLPGKGSVVRIHYRPLRRARFAGALRRTI